MAKYGISRAFMFCLDEPDRHPAFRAANDRTLAFAARSNGRLIPFVRLDLNETPIEEARRCLDAGARGIKLHPRAQSFTATDERLGPVFELAARAARADPDPRRPRAAADRRRPARARRPLSRGDADHRPRRDRRPRRARALHGRPQGRLLRHLDLEPDRPARLLPPGAARAGRLRVRLSVRAAAVVAPDRAQDRALRRLRDEQLRGMLGGTANALADGASCRSRRRRSGASCSPSRCSSRASTSTSRWRRRCSGRASPTRSASSGSRSTPAPSANGHADDVDRIRELLEAARDLWLSIPTLEDEIEQRLMIRLTLRLIHIADIEAVTAA